MRDTWNRARKSFSVNQRGALARVSSFPTIGSYSVDVENERSDSATASRTTWDAETWRASATSHSLSWSGTGKCTCIGTVGRARETRRAAGADERISGMPEPLGFATATVIGRGAKRGRALPASDFYWLVCNGLLRDPELSSAGESAQHAALFFPL